MDSVPLPFKEHPYPFTLQSNAYFIPLNLYPAQEQLESTSEVTNIISRPDGSRVLGEREREMERAPSTLGRLVRFSS